jgi:hypothetical protein
VPAQRLGQARDRARHADALVAAVVDPALKHVAVAVARLAQEQVLPLVLAHAGARAGVELDHLLPVLAGQVHEHRAGTADAAHHRVDHALHQRAGDRRVHRVAAGAEHVAAGLGGHRLGTDDHPSHQVSSPIGNAEGP